MPAPTSAPSSLTVKSSRVQKTLERLKYTTPTTLIPDAHSSSYCLQSANVTGSSLKPKGRKTRHPFPLPQIHRDCSSVPTPHVLRISRGGRDTGTA